MFPLFTWSLKYILYDCLCRSFYSIFSKNGISILAEIVWVYSKLTGIWCVDLCWCTNFLVFQSIKFAIIHKFSLYWRWISEHFVNCLSFECILQCKKVLKCHFYSTIHPNYLEIFMRNGDNFFNGECFKLMCGSFCKKHISPGNKIISF